MIIAFILFFILVIYLFYRSRRITENVRQSLSDDIHDEIGSILTKTAMTAEILKNRTGGQYPELQQIENNLREAVQSMRNVLWTLDGSQNRTSDLVNRIRQTVDFVFSNTDFNCIVTDRSARLKFNRSFEVKRNIIFVVRELANNCLKYSNGNQFEVVIRYRGGKWKLDIADNGHNMDHEKPLQLKGKGLKTIQRRMQAIGGEVEFKRTAEGFFTALVF